MNDEIELTDEQWSRVKDLWNATKDIAPSLMELTKAAFGKDDLDGRTKEGRAVRKKLAEAQMKFRTTKDYVAKPTVDLDEPQKEYIKSNYKSMSSLEMAKVLFNNPSLSNLGQETKAVAAFIKSFEPQDVKAAFENPDNLPTGNYRPPKMLTQVLARVNRYTNQQFEESKLTGKQKKDLMALINFLHTYRFNRQINIYDNIEDRELFESSFIRYTYDKHDLTEEEVDQYISLATEVVTSASIQARTESLKKLLDESTDGKDKDVKISMALVEAITSAHTEYNQCVTRQQKLLESLKIKRSEKEGKAKVGTASVLNLVQAWKDEVSRKKMIKLAQLQKQKFKEGIDELSTIDELKAKIYGLSVEEALNG
jgi:hypothetical protein